MNLRSIFCWFHLFLTRDTIIKENLDRKRDREHIEKKLGFFLSTETFHQLRRPMTRQWQKVVNYLQQKFHVSTVIHTHTRERERERAESSQKSKTLFFQKKKKWEPTRNWKNHPKKKGAKINLKPLLIGWFWIVSLLQLAPISFCFARWWRDLCVKFLTLNEKCCLCTLNSYIFLF